MRSIRRGIQLPLLIGVPLLTLLMGLMSALLVTDRLRSDFDAALRAKAQVFASLTQYVGADRQIELNFSDELMPEFARRERPEYFELWNAQGQLVERSHSLRTSPLPRGALPDGVASLRDYRTEDDRPGRLIQFGFTPDQPDDQHRSVKAAPATLLVGVGTDHLEALVWRVYLIDLASTLLLAVVLSGLIHRVLDQGLRPLAEVATQVAAIGVGNLGARLEVSSTAEELGPVVARINALLAVVDEAMTRERQFSADVAHELRTPVAELKNLAEVGTRWPADAELASGFYADALSIAQQMERMVEQLLVLAQADAAGTTNAGAAQRTMEPVDLQALVQNIWSGMATHAAPRGIVLSTRLHANREVLSDAAVLQMLLRNLFGNAVQYSPTHSEVEVRLQRQLGQSWEMSVSNAAPDLEQADIAHLFERFWRKDAARSDGAHVGLGLALVRSLARTIGLDVRAALTADRRLTIFLTSRLSC